MICSPLTFNTNMNAALLAFWLRLKEHVSCSTDFNVRLIVCSIITYPRCLPEQGLIEHYDGGDVVYCSKPMHILECGVDTRPDFMLIIGKQMMDELTNCVCLAVLKKEHNPRPNSGPPRGS